MKLDACKVAYRCRCGRPPSFPSSNPNQHDRSPYIVLQNNKTYKKSYNCQCKKKKKVKSKCIRDNFTFLLSRNRVLGFHFLKKKKKTGRMEDDFTSNVILYLDDSSLFYKKIFSKIHFYKFQFKKLINTKMPSLDLGLGLTFLLSLAPALSSSFVTIINSLSVHT